MASIAQTNSKLIGKFTLSVSSVLEVQHYCTITEAGDGFGATNTVPSTNEVYTQVYIEKLS